MKISLWHRLDGIHILRIASIFNELWHMMLRLPNLNGDPQPCSWPGCWSRDGDGCLHVCCETFYYWTVPGVAKKSLRRGDCQWITKTSKRLSKTQDLKMSLGSSISILRVGSTHQSLGPSRRHTRSAGISSGTDVQKWTRPVNSLPYWQEKPDWLI